MVMYGDFASRRPHAGQSIEVHEADGKSSLGRVQTSSADSIVVAVPSVAGIAVTAAPGSEFDLLWPGRGGVSVMPTSLTRRHGASQLELWEFAPAGPTRFEQRRRQARIVAAGPVQLAVYSQADPASASPTDSNSNPETPLDGELIDISEVAVQCVVPLHAGDPVLTAGTLVQCDFSPHGAHFVLRGEVHAAWTAEAPPRLRVVIRFDADQPGAAKLAEFVRAAEQDADEPSFE